MCRSIPDGGQRCAAHTRRPFEQTTMSDPNWDERAAQYASTPEGQAVLTQQAAQYAEQGNLDREARCRAALGRGETLREANQVAAAEIARRDLSRWEPAAIDGELARIYGEVQQARVEVDHAWQQARYVADRAAARPSWGRSPVADSQVREELEDLAADPNTRWGREAREALTTYYELTGNLDDLTRATKPYDREFHRRGGWSRAFLVTNVGGHVHRDMNCSTCRPTTRYHWVTEMSDKSESEIVEAAGERACTTCWPSAPAGTLNRPTRLFTPEEREQAAAREQRAAAADQRQQDRIAKALTPDGSEFVVETGGTIRVRGVERPRTERFKTERAAVTWMVHDMAAYRTWRASPMPEELAAAHERIIEAIAAKHDQPVEEVREEIDRKVQAKIRREGRG